MSKEFDVTLGESNDVSISIDEHNIIDIKENKPVQLDLSIEDALPLNVSMEEAIDLSIEIENSPGGGGVIDYNKAINKPKLNGKTLIGNVNEIDPTVSQWAKQPEKPSYTPNEVGALDRDSEMSFSDIKLIWDGFFN